MSFALTHLIGFGGAAPKALTETQVTDYTGTTNIGDITRNGGLASLFDGDTSQAYTAGGGGASTSTPMWGGKQWAASKIMSKAMAYGCNGTGSIYWSTGGGSSTMTVTLYGKQTSPSSGTDGTSLGSNTIAQNNAGPITVTSSDTSTAWAYNWLYFSSADSWGTGYGTCSEIIFFEMA